MLRRSLWSVHSTNMWSLSSWGRSGEYSQRSYWSLRSAAAEQVKADVTSRHLRSAVQESRVRSGARRKEGGLCGFSCTTSRVTSNAILWYFPATTMAASTSSSLRSSLTSCSGVSAPPEPCCACEMRMLKVGRRVVVRRSQQGPARAQSTLQVCDSQQVLRSSVERGQRVKEGICRVCSLSIIQCGREREGLVQLLFSPWLVLLWVC